MPRSKFKIEMHQTGFGKILFTVYSREGERLFEFADTIKELGLKKAKELVVDREAKTWVEAQPKEALEKVKKILRYKRNKSPEEKEAYKWLKDYLNEKTSK